MGFNCLKATAISRKQFTFYHSVPRNSWYSFYRPRKDERLSRPWSHPVVLNTALLDWESSALTTRPLLKTKRWTKSHQKKQHEVVYFLGKYTTSFSMHFWVIILSSVTVIILITSIFKWSVIVIWDKVFKNGPSEICGRELLKTFTWSILDIQKQPPEVFC